MRKFNAFHEDKDGQLSMSGEILEISQKHNYFKSKRNRAHLSRGGHILTKTYLLIH
jgi:hypothetical protein